MNEWFFDEPEVSTAKLTIPFNRPRDTLGNGTQAAAYCGTTLSIYERPISAKAQQRCEFAPVHCDEKAGLYGVEAGRKLAGSSRASPAAHHARSAAAFGWLCKQFEKIRAGAPCHGSISSEAGTKELRPAVRRASRMAACARRSRSLDAGQACLLPPLPTEGRTVRVRAAQHSSAASGGLLHRPNPDAQLGAS
jgi:hypothetical protein